MNPKFRSLLAVVTAIGIGGLTVAVFEVVNSRFFPLPEGLDMTDAEALGRAIADAGPSVLLGVALGWFWGSFVGAWLATVISGTETRTQAGVVVGFLLAGSLFNLIAIPHPIWFWVVGLTAVAAGGHFGWALGCGTVRKRAKAGRLPTPAG